MTTPSTDTIAAIATPPGRGGVGVVRVSGPRVRDIATQIVGGLPAPRIAVYRPFRGADGSVIDQGLALFFQAPHSFTGEDVLELQGHGGPVVMDLLLRRVIEIGARLARPGEFSERAFLNGKLDLAQAEAVADLIESSSEQAARAAMLSLQGEFSDRINRLVEELVQLRMFVESAIDFPEEEIDFLNDSAVAARLDEAVGHIDAVLESAQQGRLLRDGMTVVIAGRPNAGKSSLLNRLVQREAAIVTDIPGTTRDVLREYIHIDGMPLHVIDTAGLREGADHVEQEGIRRAWDEIGRADRILLVIDDQQGLGEADERILAQLGAKPALTLVRNKIDLTGRPPGLHEGPLGPEVALSARTGAGLEVLRGHLKECMGYHATTEGVFLARRRHLDALRRARAAIVQGREQLELHRAGELLAEDLRAAQNALSEITGEFTTEDLLDRIFSSFCIGK